MANTDKDILITPNNGSSSADPKIEFKGADASTSAQTITATAYPTNNGTLSFDGSAGQLFSITNDMTGTIFSVNDVSGIPSIEVDDDGTIRFAEYSGNVLIGTATDDGSKLQVNGTVAANNITLGDTIYHNGDTNTFVSFGTDIVNITTGGTARIYADNTGVRLGDTGNGYFQPVSGEYGSIQIDGGAHGGWEGYSIGGRITFMHDNASGAGIYNDVDNEWFFYAARNASVYLYYNGLTRFSTTPTGVDISGDLNAVDNVYVADKIYHEGDTDTSIGMETDAIRLKTGGADFYFDGQGLFITGGSLAEVYNGLSGTTPTCNVDNAGAFSLTMTGNTTFTFSGPNSGYSQCFVLQLTGNGGTVTWPTSVDWAGGTAPDAPASGETDIYVFWTRDGGTTWYGVLSVDAAA
jgi:hypothetical protein